MKLRRLQRFAFYLEDGSKWLKRPLLYRLSYALGGEARLEEREADPCTAGV